MSTAPATASSSSSQSSRLNWQPSQDENFQAASLGFRCGRISHLPLAEPRLDRTVAEHRPILAHKQRAKLAVPAEADAAFHIALHRNIDVIVGHAPFLE